MPIYQPEQTEAARVLAEIFKSVVKKLPLPDLSSLSLPGAGKGVWREPQAGESVLPFLPKLRPDELFSALVRTGGKLMEAPEVMFAQPLQMTSKWYSPLQKVISEKMPSKAPVEAVRGLVKGAGLKADELKWSGLDDYLNARTGNVTKEELMGYLKENEVQIKEIVKGDRVGTYNISRAQQLQDQIDQATGLGDFVRARELDTELGILTGRDASKFSQWQLPGGENYRELLLQLPEKPLPPPSKEWLRFQELGAKIRRERTPAEEAEFRRLGMDPTVYHPKFNTPEPFQSQHWDEPDILAHIRFNDRIDASGKKTLFIEEVQSDWHQTGREKGYLPRDIDKKPLSPSELKELENFELNPPRFIDSPEQARFEELGRRHYTTEEFLDAENIRGVPEAPFSKTWHELTMKRMVRWAVDNGYDRIAWTTGEQQAERYNQLLRNITQIGVSQRPNEQWMVTAKTRDGQTILNKIVPTDELKATVGSKVTQDILATKGENILGETVRVLNYPEGLTIGGEGMKGFYDKMIPDFMNKFGKKWGSKVSETEIPYALDNPEYKSGRSPIPLIGAKVHSFDITPQMKQSVQTEGLPLFLQFPPPQRREENK